MNKYIYTHVYIYIVRPGYNTVNTIQITDNSP